METSPPAKHKGGRPLGSMSKLAHEARKQAQETGQLPHEILLDMARGKPIKQLVVAAFDGDEPVYEERWLVPTYEQRADAAKAAAPYYAPKISTVEVIAGVSDDDLDRIIAGAAAEAGIGLGPAGEGEEGEGEDGASEPTPSVAPAGAGRERRRARRSE